MNGCAQKIPKQLFNLNPNHDGVLAARFLTRTQRRKAMTDHTASTAPKGHAPWRKP
jgi:hypothetical protein